jgi:hypothetical protein
MAKESDRILAVREESQSLTVSGLSKIGLALGIKGSELHAERVVGLWPRCLRFPPRRADRVGS